MSVVATLGVGQFLVLFAFAINSQAGAGALYPQPSGMPEFRVGALLVTPSYSGMLFLSPIVVLGDRRLPQVQPLRHGHPGRGGQPRGRPHVRHLLVPDELARLGHRRRARRLLGHPDPADPGLHQRRQLRPALLLIALTGAVLARMQSLPLALFAGAGIGIIEQLLLWNYAQAGLVDCALFVIILLSLLLQRQRVGRAEEKGSWAAVQAARPLPQAIRKVLAGRA